MQGRQAMGMEGRSAARGTMRTAEFPLHTAQLLQTRVPVCWGTVSYRQSQGSIQPCSLARVLSELWQPPGHLCSAGAMAGVGPGLHKLKPSLCCSSVLVASSKLVNVAYCMISSLHPPPTTAPPQAPLPQSLKVEKRIPFSY